MTASEFANKLSTYRSDLIIACDVDHPQIYDDITVDDETVCLCLGATTAGIDKTSGAPFTVEQLLTICLKAPDRVMEVTDGTWFSFTGRSVEIYDHDEKYIFIAGDEESPEFGPRIDIENLTCASCNKPMAECDCEYMSPSFS